MYLVFIISLAIYSVELISCESEEDARVRLYKAIFIDIEPPLEQNEVTAMLKELKGLSQNDELLIERIDELLEISEVTADKCRDGKFVFANYKSTGRAKQLVAISKRLQLNLCKGLWESALLPLIEELDEGDEILVRSIIKSMIDANEGKEFTRDWLEMPYENAQEGLLRFMETRSGRYFSHRTKEDSFNEIFSELILEPCRRIKSKLEPLYEKYMYLVRFFDSNQAPNPMAYEWTRNSLICKRIDGSGYSSDRFESVQRNMFKNLKHRRTKWWYYKS